MSKKELNLKNIKIRFHEDGSVDEIITYDQDGVCNFHMEQMDKNHLWMQFYSTKAVPLEKDIVINIGSQKDNNCYVPIFHKSIKDCDCPDTKIYVDYDLEEPD